MGFFPRRKLREIQSLFTQKYCGKSLGFSRGFWSRLGDFIFSRSNTLYGETNNRCNTWDRLPDLVDMECNVESIELIDLSDNNVSDTDLD